MTAGLLSDGRALILTYFNLNTRTRLELNLNLNISKLVPLSISDFFQTLVHWMSIVLSVAVYFGFALLYNGACPTCFGMANLYWVVQNSMGTPTFWLVSLLAAVLAVLPR